MDYPIFASFKRARSLCTVATIHTSLPNSILAAWRRRREETRGYVVAVVASTLAALLGLMLESYLERSTFILFAAPVALTAWYGGRGPAFLATALGILGADLVFLERSRFLIPLETRDIVAVAAYVGVVDGRAEQAECSALKVHVITPLWRLLCENPPLLAARQTFLEPKRDLQPM